MALQFTYNPIETNTHEGNSIAVIAIVRYWGEQLRWVCDEGKSADVGSFDWEAAGENGQLSGDTIPSHWRLGVYDNAAHSYILAPPEWVDYYYRVGRPIEGDLLQEIGEDGIHALAMKERNRVCDAAGTESAPDAAGISIVPIREEGAQASRVRAVQALLIDKQTGALLYGTVGTDGEPTVWHASDYQVVDDRLGAGWRLHEEGSEKYYLICRDQYTEVFRHA